MLQHNHSAAVSDFRREVRVLSMLQKNDYVVSYITRSFLSYRTVLFSFSGAPRASKCSQSEAVYILYVLVDVNTLVAITTAEPITTATATATAASVDTGEALWLLQQARQGLHDHGACSRRFEQPAVRQDLSVLWSERWTGYA
jgi:hypothetical protein